MTPYYRDDEVTVWHGDCRDILPSVHADVMVTDPPYGRAFCSGWTGSAIAGDADTSARDAVLADWTGPALAFGSPAVPEPTGVKARLVWHRPGSGMGDLAMPWKPDFEMVYVLGSGFSAEHRGSSVLTVPWDVFRGDAFHPHQKPVSLMRTLIRACPPGVILDPFMGSGSTLVAAKFERRRAIGIEVEERYCEVAAKRLAQGVLAL